MDDETSGVKRRDLTPNQCKALLWLTPGQKRGDPPRSVSSALKSLVMHHADLATSAWEQTPRGRDFLAFSLTPGGELERAKLVAADAEPGQSVKP